MTTQVGVRPVIQARALDPPDSDRFARQLAFITVGVPTLGFIGAVAYAIHYGLRWFDVILFGSMYLFTGFGVEGGFHRLFSHRSYRARGWLDAVIAVAGSMAAQGPLLFWVATHRIHHAFSDREGDPHSPSPRGEGRWAVVKGLWHGHVGWLFTVRRDSWARHVKDLMQDRRLMKVSRLYFVWVVLGLAIPVAISALYYGSARGALAGLLIGGLSRVFLLDHVVWSVNSIGHSWGNRAYRSRDNSRNVASLAGVTIGGSWHNNHHAVPASAYNNHRWWQVDITGTAIRLAGLIGLVTNIHGKSARVKEAP